jgi:hypothetical protein
MLLQLSSTCNVNELISEIKALEANLLIFLRNLKQINIEIQAGNGLPWRKTLERRAKSNGSDGQHITTLHDQSRTTSFRTFRLHVDNLSADLKRPGLNQSDILLAFPVEATHRSKLTSQNVYAFLPIRDYGFKVSHRVLS